MSEEKIKNASTEAQSVPAAGAEGAEAAAPARPSQPTAADLLKADLGEVTIRRAKGSKNISSGVVHILATFNNTKVAFTDRQGNVISWSSSARCTSAVRARALPTPHRLLLRMLPRSHDHGLKEVEVHVRAQAWGRDSAIVPFRALAYSSQHH
jgi:small subunit ribosomal protein S11